MLGNRKEWFYCIIIDKPLCWVSPSQCLSLVVIPWGEHSHFSCSRVSQLGLGRKEKREGKIIL